MDTLQEVSTTEEAARFLRLQPQTLEAWRLRGTGPAFVKLGRRVVYRRAALERFMAEQERNSTSDPGQRDSALRGRG
ncbi:MAG: helix-turn-helix domain-containing protein [Thermoanaerobaculia bacterium]